MSQNWFTHKLKYQKALIMFFCKLKYFKDYFNKRFLKQF